VGRVLKGETECHLSPSVVADDGELLMAEFLHELDDVTGHR